MAYDRWLADDWVPDYPADCSNIVACRRFALIVRDNGGNPTRGCNKACTAYRKIGRDMFTADQVKKLLAGGTVKEGDWF